MKRCRRLLSTGISLLLLLTISPLAYALERDNVDENIVTFCGLDELKINQRMEQRVLDSNGNEAIVGIERVATEPLAYRSGSTWRVWFTGVTINAEFYMTVSGNKVTSVYDDSISVVGGTYEDEELTSTTTYGKLTFKVKSIAGIIAGKCWLKGTVTGIDDKIEVTWQM